MFTKLPHSREWQGKEGLLVLWEARGRAKEGFLHRFHLLQVWKKEKRLHLEKIENRAQQNTEVSRWEIHSSMYGRIQ